MNRGRVCAAVAKCVREEWGQASDGRKLRFDHFAGQPKIVECGGRDGDVVLKVGGGKRKWKKMGFGGLNEFWAGKLRKTTPDYLPNPTRQ